MSARGRPATGVVVTGGGSGLGRATCLALAEAGRPVAVWDIDGPGAKDVVAECARRYSVAGHAEAVDVGDDDAVTRAASTTLAALPSIGGIVHAAAVLRYGPIGHVSLSEWDLSQNVNLRAFVTVSQALLPALRAAGTEAAMVAVASTEGLRGHPGIPAYTASKHGLVGLVRSMALALGREGIRVNAVCPGAMDTPMLAAALASSSVEQRQRMNGSIPLGRISDPAEVGRVIRFLLSEDASYVTGVALPVDGGMTAGSD